MEVQDQGTVLDNYYVAEAAAFDKANPGDTVTMNVVPTNNVYKQKLLLELQGQSPPALFMTWGGGISRSTSRPRSSNPSVTPA